LAVGLRESILDTDDTEEGRTRRLRTKISSGPCPPCFILFIRVPV
jgi:hypothetical protein